MPEMADRLKINKFRASLGVLVLAVWCLVGALTMLVCKGLRLTWVRSFPLVFHGFVCRLFSMRVEYVGELDTSRPIMYVANHTSYLDVFVLGSLIRGAFVAKSEVASWPVFGKLAKLQNTMFLERRSQRAVSHIEQVHEHLHHESNLILFPEGTSTSGTWVAPFRSSLFAAAYGVKVQPVTVAYLDYDGVPMSQAERDHFAWYLPDPKQAIPNKPFVSHFFNGLGLRSSRVQVTFHKPILVAEAGRKEAAAACEQAVRQGLESALGSVTA